MSRLVFRSEESMADLEDATPAVNHHHMILEATVKPMGSADYDKDRVADQARELSELRTKGKDLFEVNETRKVHSAGTTLYQTTETYGTAMSIETIIETLRQYDLTLRVNFNRPGVHSNTTCMELSADTLAKLLASEADATGNKTAELRVKAERAAKVPRHGQMYVAISQKGTQHYLSHIDYKIMGSYDAMYHEESS